jgi:hypothetical protein
VTASARAMLASATAFQQSLVMDWAVRSGSVAASARAMLPSALAFTESSANVEFPKAGHIGGTSPRDLQSLPEVTLKCHS